MKKIHQMTNPPVVARQQPPYSRHYADKIIMQQALIHQRINQVIEKINHAAARAGRSPEHIKLIAVSKTRPTEDIASALEGGLIHFGENKPQEAEHKIPQFHNSRAIWHYIGHLQSNKSKIIPGNFEWIHSIDSLKLLTRLENQCAESGSTLNFLLQVNVSLDPAKFGLLPDQLYSLVEQILEADFKVIRLRGLMTIGRKVDHPEDARQAFRHLRQLSDYCGTHFGEEHFTELSMGMTHDYEQAIEEGATMVRVGTGIFGERRYPAMAS